MKILITGGTGFIGSHLAMQLHSLGHEIVVTGAPSCETRKFPSQIQVLPHGPIGIDWNRVARWLGEDPLDVLFHQSANNDTTWDDDDEMEFSNVTSSLEVFRKCAKLGCAKIIYASSTAVYGNSPAPYKENETPTQPLNAYARSKLWLESECNFVAKQFNAVIIGLRYCNVYGPGEGKKGKRASMIYQLAQQIRQGKATLFKDGEQRRDQVFVDDVVRANILAMECNKQCVVNVGSGESVTFNHIHKIISETLGKTYQKPNYIDNPNIDAYQTHTQCDLTLAYELLGYMPKYDIVEGIKEYHRRGGFGE